MGWNENIALAEGTQHHTCNHSAAVKGHSQNRALFKSAFGYNCKLFTVLSTKPVDKITTSDDVLACYNSHNGAAPLFSRCCAVAFKWRLCNKGGTCGPAKCKAISPHLPKRQYLSFLSFCIFSSAAAVAAMLNGEQSYEEQPVDVLGRGRVSE